MIEAVSTGMTATFLIFFFTIRWKTPDWCSIDWYDSDLPVSVVFHV